MKQRVVLGWVVGTAALFAALCILLYHFDNKYTVSSQQPVKGLLTLSAQELAASPVHYLTEGWEFYPGVLLTPADIAAGGQYRVYCAIGNGPGMAHGSGTYRLVLRLPERAQSYALNLPEVFSACRLYCNGELITSLGETDPAHYREAISDRILTFTAGGQVELVLACTDYSGIYSGMTYPPAFGPAQQVLLRRDTRLLLHAACALGGLMGAVFLSCFGLPCTLRRRMISLLCCLCFSGMTGYPVFHSLFTVSYLPWYAVEISFFYGLLLLSIWLMCELYDISRAATRIFVAPCAAMLVLAVARTVFSASLGDWAALAFSGLVLGIKWYTALVLAGLSLWALYREHSSSPLILCGGTALVVCLVFDRLLPLYEPIFGGWYGEIGGAALAVALLASLGMDMSQAYRARIVYENECRLLEHRLSLQKDHYQQLARQVEQARHATHDLRHHMRALRTFAVQGDTEQLLGYLDSYETHINEQAIACYSDHPVADAVLCDYAAAAQRLHAVYDVRLLIPAALAFPDDELCVLLGNLLENAMEAMRRQNDGERRLYLRGDADGGKLRLIVNNTFEGPLVPRGRLFASTKPGSQGLGLRSVQSIAQKYGGLADFSAEGTEFHVMVVVPLSGSAAPTAPTAPTAPSC